jgi:hypothetical protein
VTSDKCIYVLRTCKTQLRAARGKDASVMSTIQIKRPRIIIDAHEDTAFNSVKIGSDFFSPVLQETKPRRTLHPGHVSAKFVDLWTARGWRKMSEAGFFS